MVGVKRERTMLWERQWTKRVIESEGGMVGERGGNMVKGRWW